jgi:hypothetical protein
MNRCEKHKVRLRFILPTFSCLNFLSPKPKIMNTNKFLIGGIIGGIAYFLLGWVVWGMLLMDFMQQNMGTATGVMKAEADMDWLYLGIGNLFSGLALSYVLNKAGAKGIAAGAGVGAFVSLLISAGFNFTMLGTSNITTLNGAMVDIAANAVVGAIVGGIIGLYLGIGKKAT